MTRRRSRKVGAALLAAGLLSAAGAAWQAIPASADSSLLSFELTATSHGAATILPSGDSGTMVGGFVPEAEASLATGPIGLGLASIAWPGPTAANGGTLLAVLVPGAPPQASSLNYPLRAESRTGETPATKTFDGPGFSLRSTSLPNLVESDAHVESATSGLLSLGAVTTLSRTSTTDGGGLSEANSTTQDISIADVLKIQSVTSTATAKTTGDSGTGDAKTIVSGVTVGGQPATIDEQGLHLADQNGTPIGAVANQIARQALSSAGITVTVTAPTKKIEGGTVDTTAGVLVIDWKTSGGEFSATFGGSSASAQSSPGVGDLTGDLGAGGLGAGTDLGATPVDSGSLGDLGSTPVDTGTAPSTGTGSGAQALGPTRNVAATGKPIKPGAIILGVLAAGLLAVGMRRLGDDVLAEQAGTTCPLDGDAS
jgi:hypothetical protein